MIPFPRTIFNKLAGTVIILVTYVVAAHTSVLAQTISQIVKDRIEGRINDLRKQGHYDQAFQLGDSVLNSDSQLDSRWLATLMTEQGVTCMYQGRYSTALELFHNSLTIRDRLGDSSDIAESYNNMASVHHAQSDLKPLPSIMKRVWESENTWMTQKSLESPTTMLVHYMKTSETTIRP